MDPARANPVTPEFNPLPYPRTPRHHTSPEGENACSPFQPHPVHPVPTQNGTPHHSSSLDPAFPHLTETAVELSPTADTWLDEGEQRVTYAELIHIALRSRKPKPMGLGELYHWFEQNTRRANERSEGWKSSVRSNLSMNKAFRRVERKGSLWQLAEAGSTGFQPTRKPRTGRRAGRGKRAEVSTEWKISVAPRPPAYAPTLPDASLELVSGSDRGDDGPWALAGSISTEETQPESGPYTDYPTPMSTVPMQDGLEYTYDPLWAWNLDSRRYIHWPYCSCLCGRHHSCWTSADDMLQPCFPAALPPTLVHAGVGSSPPSETAVQWEV
ncbi:hypothetical protein CNYM01_13926 [Colletotrichum nymphaeae SA-01]|uniref:Fork-head domain-containing protein n=1 Tax=Colletotrichum nymphaeae SA-01 TaxID=1460502 RepID=A0A135S440_9PEZI|nr:hypothetical protein CNYM01_13926 [Colletotrichum nymphaeae SA-01]